MKILEDTRSAVVALIENFLVTNFPTIPVDYQYRSDVDAENTDEYIKVEIGLKAKPLYITANKSYEVLGEIFLIHYRRENGGSSAFTNFTDEFFNSFSMQTKNGITFYTVNSFKQSGKPGFDGVVNVVNLSVDKLS